jgi:hypothetical protein
MAEEIEKETLNSYEMTKLTAYSYGQARPKTIQVFKTV